MKPNELDIGSPSENSHGTIISRASTKHFHCEFCDELEGGINNSFYSISAAKDKLTSRIIRETEYFVAIPGIGSLLPGYILVLPKAHVVNMGQLKFNLFDELESLIIELRHEVHCKLKLKTVIFEHGSTNPSDSSLSCGECIEHAHIHICPTNLDINPKFNKNDATTHCIDKLYQLRLWGVNNKPYVFYENLIGARFVFELSKSLPSQYMRKLWANALTVPDYWDWAVFPMYQNIVKTIQMFAPELL